MTKEFDARNEKKSRSVCAAMAESADTDKRVLSEKERSILDMWPRFEDTGEPVMVGDKALSNKDEMFKVYRIQFIDGIWMLNDNPVLGHYKNGDCETRVERPAPEVLDADGVSIREGDTVWIIPALTDTPDEPHEVIGINRWGEVLLEFHTEGSTGLKGEYLTHTRPDSWEQLEEDARKGACEYAGAYLKRDTIDSHECDGCRCDADGYGPTCEQQMALDIIRRAKKLAGVE